jgi:nitronate monooxygenase
MENSMNTAKNRAKVFCELFNLRVPILLGPMSGASAPSLSIAVANAGGLGACGALLMQPNEIIAWANNVRANTKGQFQINLWIPDPPPKRDPEHEARVRKFLANWGPAVPPEAGDPMLPNFAAQCEALLAAAPPIVSSVMGIFPPEFVAKLKARGITWFANVSTVAEARAAEGGGADVIVAQGSEAGGHRYIFNAADAEAKQVGLFSLIPAVVDAVKIPVVAAGGIADARGIAAALILGASVVQIGTGLLRCPESKINSTWANALAQTAPENTILTRAFSGRAGRSIATDYVRAASADGAPRNAPYPVQRGLTAAMRSAAEKAGDVQRMQMWAGQSAALAKAKPAAELVRQLWEGAQEFLA